MTGGAVRLAGYRSFHVGGRRVSVSGRAAVELKFSAEMPAVEQASEGDYLVDQAYVQCFQPEDRRLETPVLLIHGGGLTGAIWEATADGQPGWVTRLLQAGVTVYVIDNVERGRAGWCALPGQGRGEPVMRSDQEAWALYRLGRAGDYASRTPFPGQQFPIAHFDRLSRHHVPRWTTSDAATEAALLEALGIIGPAVLVGHSQGGGFAFRTAYRHPDLVPACLGIEPHGVPLPHDAVGVERQAYAVMLGDFILESPLWIDLAGRSADVIHAIGERNGHAELIDLPALGVPGNSHMPMLDGNSDQVVAELVRWLDRLIQAGRLR